MQNIMSGYGRCISNKRRHALRLVIIIVAICCTRQGSFSQAQDPSLYVNPFIGTARSNVFTRWGNEGGTYPGAVAPFGFMQLSPEARAADTRGYDYSDSAIFFFSCINHHSGFPGGSSGRVCVMPVDEPARFEWRGYRRYFRHADEQAGPGYYRVLFRDNNTLAEATAAGRAGMFRFTFPPHVVPRIFIGDMGAITIAGKQGLRGSMMHTVVHFSENSIASRKVKDGYMITFAPSHTGAKTVLLELGVSDVSYENATANIRAAIHTGGFDQLREHTRSKWQKALSVIDIDDPGQKNKTIFYTALYHALLMPWIISDADGRYRGADGLIHTTQGKNEYGGFSPWDTFRSLHPLLCLLFPERQCDMVSSMLDIYRQTGHLPVESMTGNHSIPIITDTYLKGITGFDSSLAYEAMKKSLLVPPFIQPDMEVYQAKGYIPFSMPESVTRTVEYAYDDWVLAQFSKQVMHRDNDYNHLLQRSFYYRNLFNADELFFLPRKDSTFRLQPGTFGYKEGDKWVYSFFVPHNVRDLVNLMGGNELFSFRLDSAFRNNNIVFDNETVFHIPYLFNYAGHPQKTQEWVGAIMRSRFDTTAGGLPGNDDLGSMSAWYVLSAMGIFPVCPGYPGYALSTPVFRSLTIHPGSNKPFVIKTNRSAAGDSYIKSVSVNGQEYRRLWLPHATMAQGGEIIVETAGQPQTGWYDDNDLTTVSETSLRPSFQITGYAVSKQRVVPHELFWVRFSIKNNGSPGTRKVQLFVNGMPYAYKNCLAGYGSVVTDSIACRLYPLGRARLQIDSLAGMDVEVVKEDSGIPGPADINALVLKPVIRKGELQTVSFSAQNTGGTASVFYIPVALNDSLVLTDSILLQPGEIKTMSEQLRVNKEGLQTIRVNNKTESFKAYSSAEEATILDLPLDIKPGDSMTPDQSGFGNNGKICRTNGSLSSPGRLLFGEDCFVEIPNAISLDSMGESMTMMLWVYPTQGGSELVDLLTKGDNHVLQVAGNKMLGFFAGGWGRGDCSVPLPAGWLNNWHHLAGVCNGDSLYVYIDGTLKGSNKVEGRVNLSVSNKWNVGRNEEFPSQRIFHGYIKDVKIFAAPLSGKEINSLFIHSNGRSLFHALHIQGARQYIPYQ